MTVKELKETLAAYPDDATVVYDAFESHDEFDFVYDMWFDEANNRIHLLGE